MYEINFDSNWKLEFNDLKAMFKPSVPYTLDVDIDDIEYASYSGSFADWEYHRGNNNKRLKKLINMFCRCYTGTGKRIAKYISGCYI